jgi:addiction module RelE/StbE family toxin
MCRAVTKPKRIEWTPSATEDLAHIRDYIGMDNPTAARNVVRKIFDHARSLVTFPERTRAGRVNHTREAVIPNLPYIIVYRVKGDRLEVLRVLHGAQQWP